MSKSFRIENRQIGADAPCYIIAEVSCNHEGSFDEAVRIVKAAADSGADAVKLQTYTADSMTRDFGNSIKGTMWEGADLYDLYKKAHTPRDWHEKLQRLAKDEGLHFFSSPFDESAVDYLSELDVPAFKIASFELVDKKLLEHVARQSKPVIISNGMSYYLELFEAVVTLRSHGVTDLAILHCNSGYPASFSEAHLRTIPFIAEHFDVVAGLSDHTLFWDDKEKKLPLAHISPIEAVKLGAKIIEVHLTIDREAARVRHQAGQGGFDWAFSRTPEELRETVSKVRQLEAGESLSYSEQEAAAATAALGTVKTAPTEKEIASRPLRPSLWVVEDIQAGEAFRFSSGGGGNVDSIRPGGGLAVRFADFIQGRTAKVDIKRGTPLHWENIQF